MRAAARRHADRSCSSASPRPPGSGLVVTELDVDMPLEITAAVRGRELVFLAQAPHSRWQAGFLPPVQRLAAKLVLEE